MTRRGLGNTEGNLIWEQQRGAGVITAIPNIPDLHQHVTESMLENKQKLKPDLEGREPLFPPTSAFFIS